MDLLPSDPVDFSTLTSEEKDELVTKLIDKSRCYRKETVKWDRKEKGECDLWTSKLTKKELMMIGQLNQNEVDSIISPSLEKSMQMLDMDSEEEDKLCQEYMQSLTQTKNVEDLVKEPVEEEEMYYMPRSFEQHLRWECIDQLLDEGFKVDPSSYKNEYFVDRKGIHLEVLNSSAGDGHLDLYLLEDDDKPNLAGMDAQEYQKRMEQLMKRQKRKYV